MKISTYKIIVMGSGNYLELTVNSTSEERAIEIVMNSERCPRSCIKSCELVETLHKSPSKALIKEYVIQALLLIGLAASITFAALAFTNSPILYRIFYGQ